MTRIRLVPFLSLTLCCLPLAAQDEMAAPPPAAELAKLKPLAGHWKGSGTAVMAPGQPPAKWTAQIRSDWTLGGHWLQTDTAVAFENGMKLRFREYLGWDRENARYVQVTVGNTGEGDLATPYFAGDDTLIVLRSGLRDGKPHAERHATKFGKDSQTFTIAYLGHEGLGIEHVNGRFDRVAKVEPEALEAAHALMPADQAMARIARTAGRFDLSGELTMAPGMPSMKIQGTDTIRTLFDGAIVQVTTTGAAEGMPGSYEAHGYYAWDPANACYKVLMVSNMGEVMCGQARFSGDDKIVQTVACLRMGQPCVSRVVTHLDAKGHPVKVVNHSCMGDADPMQDFTGTYKPAK
jgi:hypothetical protein